MRSHAMHTTVVLVQAIATLVALLMMIVFVATAPIYESPTVASFRPVVDVSLFVALTGAVIRELAAWIGRQLWPQDRDAFPPWVPLWPQ